MASMPCCEIRKPNAFGEIRHPKKRAFLAAMANTANVVRAAAIAGVDRDNHYLWLKKDPDYAAAFEIAWKRGVDVLEAEAVRRAHEGVSKPIFHGGKRAVDVVQNPDGSIKRDKSGKPISIPEGVGSVCHRFWLLPEEITNVWPATETGLLNEFVVCVERKINACDGCCLR